MKRRSAGGLKRAKLCTWGALALALCMSCACGGQASGGGQDVAGNAGAPGGFSRARATPEVPPFPDLCSRFQIQRLPGSAAQPPPLPTCNCVFNYPRCDDSSCVSSFDCTAVCAATQDRNAPSFDDCVGVGYCSNDADCGGAWSCIHLPGAKGGSCLSDWCLDDADCTPGVHCVAVTNDGVRRCGDGCNRNADCGEGEACIVPPASFLGICGNGENYSVCYDDSDCRSGRRCALKSDPTDPADRGRCTDSSDGAPCATGADCRSKKCFSSTCSEGRVDEGCGTDPDCAPGLQCVKVGITWDPDFASCTDGSEPSNCQQDSQCAPGLHCAFGMCLDGSTSDFCERDDQCQSKRCLIGAFDYQVCTTGDPGAGCMDAGDCVSGSCERAPSLRTGDPGVCN